MSETFEAAIRSDSPAEPTRARTVGLCMIVKNESRVIVRCLDSVRPLVDFMLIEDTGSTDGTQEIIRNYLHDNSIPGIVIEEPWCDFAYNRTVALAKLREYNTIDYALIMDADDVMEYAPDFDPIQFKSNLWADHYHVAIRLGGTRYFRPQICSNHEAYCFRGVLHEFLQGPEGHRTSDTAAGLLMVAGVEGARSTDPQKYLRDAAVLERALESETDPFMRSRYTFYLAQSYRDAGEIEKSLENYLRRAEMGFWDEEVYVSLYQAARLQVRVERPADEVLATYKRAIELLPRRAEALHGVSNYYRAHDRFEEGFQIARQGLPLTEGQPPNGLFIETWIYVYGLLDEYAVNGYWSDHYRESLDACLRILSHPNCPEEQRQRILDNAKFAAAKMPPADSPNLGSLGQVTAPDRDTSEDAFVTLYNAAECLSRESRPFDDIIAAYNRASDAAPRRAEALHAASRLCRWNSKFAEGYEYARRGLALQAPTNNASVQQWIYDYGLLDEYAVNAYWIERYQDCLDACQRLLSEAKMPADMYERVKKNAEFSADKLRSKLIAFDRAGFHTSAGGGGLLSGVARVINENGQFVVRAIAADQDCRWNVVVPYVRDNIHSAALQELVEAVYYGLKQLDQQVSLTNGDVPAFKNMILIGAHHLAPDACNKVPDEAIVYNSEHVDSHWLSEHYLRLLRRTTVWDYSADNAQWLEAKLGRAVVHVPLGYVPQFTRARSRVPINEDIDVLFFGSSSPRRHHILDDLQRRGLHVHYAFGVYGEERDALVERAKVVLNIHYYLPGAFEILRVAYLLSNRKAIVCELNPGETFDTDLEGAFITVPYNNVADQVADLVADPTRRSAVANLGFRKFMCRSQATVLRDALGERLTNLSARFPNLPARFP